MNNPGLIKTFKAGAGISKYRIVKFGADDDHVVQGAAAADALFGINGELDADADEQVDIVMSDVAEVEYGGNVTRGDLLTSDADGKAVTAAPAGGANNRIIGVAMVSGVAGDIGSASINPGSVQG